MAICRTLSHGSDTIRSKTESGSSKSKAPYARATDRFVLLARDDSLRHLRRNPLHRHTQDGHGNERYQSSYIVRQYTKALHQFLQGCWKPLQSPKQSAWIRERATPACLSARTNPHIIGGGQHMKNVLSEKLPQSEGSVSESTRPTSPFQPANGCVNTWIV
jgi:hypothetical protein